MSQSTKELKERHEIPKELTWDLEAIFETDEQWEKECKLLQADIPALTEFQGKLAESAETFFDLFTFQDKFSVIMIKCICRGLMISHMNVCLYFSFVFLYRV